ncbi:MAG: GNAT family N-acetyltransferase [Alistipes sp.]|nr:GNAT family N-acetyltransferase [Alistipes sp.]
MEITHNVSQHRFELTLEGEVAYLSYHQEGSRLDLQHTLVPRPIEGRGIAAQLTRHALQYARTGQLQVRPSCAYVRAYLERPPEEQDLLER